MKGALPQYIRLQAPSRGAAGSLTYGCRRASLGSPQREAQREGEGKKREEELRAELEARSRELEAERRQRSMVKVPPPLTGPQLGSCASSGRAWRLRATRHSQGEAGPLGAQPLPRVLEPAASKAADSTAF